MRRGGGAGRDAGRPPRTYLVPRRRINTTGPGPSPGPVVRFTRRGPRLALRPISAPRRRPFHCTRPAHASRITRPLSVYRPSDALRTLPCVVLRIRLSGCITRPPTCVQLCCLDRSHLVPRGFDACLFRQLIPCPSPTCVPVAASPSPPRLAGRWRSCGTASHDIPPPAASSYRRPSHQHALAPCIPSTHLLNRRAL